MNPNQRGIRFTFSSSGVNPNQQERRGCPSSQTGKPSMKFITASLLAGALASGGAFAQATPPTAPTADAALVAKFKAADKNSNGSLDGTELDTYKTNMAKIDTDKDGKISQLEFAAPTTAGDIK